MFAEGTSFRTISRVEAGGPIYRHFLMNTKD